MHGTSLILLSNFPLLVARFFFSLTNPPKIIIHPVLELISRGRGNKEIGERLFISERTVKTHVNHLLEKLDLRDRTQLVIYALQHKLFDH